MNLYDFKTSIENFLSFLLLERGLSANTPAAYGRDLRQWEKFWGRSAQALCRRENELLLFQRHLTRSDKSPATKQRIMAAMRTWMRYLDQEGMLDEDGPSLLPPGQGQTLPRILNEGELDRLFQACSGTGPLDLRDRAPSRRLTGAASGQANCAPSNSGILTSEEKPSGPRAKAKRAGNPLGEAAGRVALYLDKGRP